MWPRSLTPPSSRARAVASVGVPLWFAGRGPFLHEDDVQACGASHENNFVPLAIDVNGDDPFDRAAEIQPVGPVVGRNLLAVPARRDGDLPVHLRAVLILVCAVQGVGASRPAQQKYQGQG